MRALSRCAVAFALFLSTSLLYAAPHPVTSEVRKTFPRISLEARSDIEKAEQTYGDRVLHGFRSRARLHAASEAPSMNPVEQQAWRAAAQRSATRNGFSIFYPSLHDEAFVAQFGDQRVVIRAAGARAAVATLSEGNVVYAGAYESVDVVEVPGEARSEELLLLRDRNAPLVYDYEIVEMSGISTIELRNGAVVFVAPAAPASKGRVAAATLQIDRPWVIDSTGVRSSSAARWSIVERGDKRARLRLTVSAADLQYPLLVDPSFSVTGSMNQHRYLHTSTLLQNGKVLVTGGLAGSTLFSAEIYDPATGTFASTSVMTSPRLRHTATVLPNGKVLIAGGESNGTALSSAELFDPVAQTFTPVLGSMSSARSNHTATLLSNGTVLLVGGNVASAEIFNPFGGTNGSFSPVGSLAEARSGHTATRLPDGRVLVAGGISGPTILGTVQVFNPATNSFSSPTPLTIPRWNHTATLLHTGEVLLAAGDSTTQFSNTAELYNPGTTVSRPASGTLLEARTRHTATLRPDGTVLLVGGLGTGTPSILATAEVYDPASDTFFPTNSLPDGRWYHTATLLPDGNVFIAGGANSANFITGSSSVFSHADGGFSTFGPSVTFPREFATATVLPSGKVLIVGGPAGTAEIYDPASNSFSSTNGPSLAFRTRHTATLLPNGMVLIAGGSSDVNDPLQTTEIFNPVTGTFSPGGLLTTGRIAHTATLLFNGKVLIAGGEGGENTAEIYNPNAGISVPTGNLLTNRFGPTATLLNNGKVLIAGGVGGATLSTAELYNPATGTFSFTGTPMSAGRFLHTASLLPTGKVLLTGGFDSTGSYGATTEQYDPVTNSFSPGASFTARAYHAATVLSTGKVLLSGGYDGSSFPNMEIFDPATGSITPAGSMLVARDSHTATLLRDGRVLVVSGFGAGTSVELFNPGPFFQDFRRPVISGLATTMSQGPSSQSADFGDAIRAAAYGEKGTAGSPWQTVALGITSVATPAATAVAFTLNGSGFRGSGDGSFGSTGSSATDYPLLRLQRIDNDLLGFAPAQSWTDFSLQSVTLNGVVPGHYRASVVTNGIASLETVILVSPPPENAAPQITPSTVTMPQGGSGIRTIAFVTDAEDSPGILGVTVTSTPAGISVTSISNSNGTITAFVSVACGTTTGAKSIGLRVQDSGGASATTTLTVDVGAAQAPLLTSYANSSVLLGESTVVSPFLPPTDDGTLALTSANASAGFTGSVNVIAGGGVSITNAGPVGNHTITFTATDNCGLQNSRSFTLTVVMAGSTNLVQNGSFESNGGLNTTTFTSWSTQTMGSGGWYVQSGTSTPSAGRIATVAAPPLGTFAAMTAQLGAGVHYLYQDIVVPAQVAPATLSFRYYFDNQLGTWITPDSLNHLTAAGANQQFRVDLIDPAASIDTLTTGLLLNVFRTMPGDPFLSAGYGTVVASIPAALTGRTVRLRFAEVQNQNFFNGGIDDVRLLVASGTAPIITAAAPVGRIAGTPGGAAVAVATVSDADEPAGNLTVTPLTVPTGITVTGTTNTAGNVTAVVAAACNATPGSNTVVFRVQDSTGNITTANFTVNVTANAAPTMGEYSPLTAFVGQTTTNSPATAPADVEGAPMLSVVASAGYTGTVTVSAAGVVTVTNPNAGTFTVTVTVADTCTSINRAFTLTVNQGGAAPPTITAAAPITVKAGSAAGAAVAVATVGDPDDPIAGLTVSASSVPQGLVVATVTKGADGAVTAVISALCTATAGPKTVTFRVQDPAGNFVTADLTVNVLANTPTALGFYSQSVNVVMNAGETRVVTPTAPPSDDNAYTLEVSATQGLQTLTINQTTGAVTISNPTKAGPSFTVTVTATDSCGEVTTRTFGLQVNDNFTAPLNFVATGSNSGLDVQLTWQAAGGGTGTTIVYTIQRTESLAAPFATIKTQTTVNYTDVAVEANKVYLYRVLSSNGIAEASSAIDIATTKVFTDEPLLATHTAKTAHIEELRSVINLLRAAVGLTPFSFSDTPLLAGMPIRAQHVLQLRTAFQDVRGAIGAFPTSDATLTMMRWTAAVPYTDPTLGVGTPLRRAHIQEPRTLVR